MERNILEEAVSELKEKVLVLEDQLRSRVAQAKAAPAAVTVKSALQPRKTELERLQQKFRKRRETQAGRRQSEILSLIQALLISVYLDTERHTVAMHQC